MGISLIAMFSLMQFQKDKKNSRLTKFTTEAVSGVGSEIVIDEVETIRIATRNAGKGIFALCRYIESIGDIAQKIKFADTKDD